MAQDYSQQFNMFGGDPLGEAFRNRGIMGLDNETLTNLAILRDNIRDQQGNVLTFDMQPTNNILYDEDEDDYENIERFAEEPDYRNIFQKGYDAYMDQSGTSRGIMNLVLSGGNPFAAAAGFFAPQIASSVRSGLDYLFGNRLDERQLAKNIESAESDSPDSSGISSFDAAVSAGIRAAEDDA
tara:strand:+ start:1062 stop:1610 length:549 start_codon:yes stop_codon:yes gene_type:complete